MEENDNVGPIQRYYYEDAMARMERTNKRWFIAWLITFILLVGCVTGFVWYEAQFVEETVTETYEANADDAGTAIANGSGEVNYGTG